VKGGIVFGRAVIAFLTLPGMVAYVVPVLLAPSEVGGAAWRILGIAVIASGTMLLLWCVRDYYVTGEGTLAPWTPPRHLVRTGLYRWSRNPMYVSVLVVVSGWAVLYRSPSLLAYLGALALVFHLRVLLSEEPRLSASFREEWLRYRQEVPRWVRQPLTTRKE
jgi:protein-S-isoprenylcysteine O-methyltransferase Ste14